MTSPLAEGGRPFNVGQQPVLLSETAAGPEAPLLVINTSTQLVWIAGHSGVGPSNGVPLEPGTSLPWVAVGQVWAVADPAATAAAAIVISGAVRDWLPSPAAIASQTAAALLAQGIPTVYTLKALTGSPFTIPAGNAVAIDVTGYATLYYRAALIGAPVAPMQLQAQWLLPDGTSLGLDDDLSSVVGGPVVLATPTPAGALPVRSNHLLLNNPSANAVEIWLTGTNKVMPSDRPYINGFSTTGFERSTGTIAMNVGTSYPLGGLGGTAIGRAFQGPAYAEFALTNSGAKGIFACTVETGDFVGPYTFDLIDTGALEWHTGANGIAVAYKQIALPAAPFSLGFVCELAATTNAFIRAIPAY